MTTLEIILIVFLIMANIISVLSINAAYRNGATDGYGYARERGNPGYQRAGDYLKRTMSHRWRELSE